MPNLSCCKPAQYFGVFIVYTVILCWSTSAEDSSHSQSHLHNVTLYRSAIFQVDQNNDHQFRAIQHIRANRKNFTLLFIPCSYAQQVLIFTSVQAFENTTVFLKYGCPISRLKNKNTGTAWENLHEPNSNTHTPESTCDYSWTSQKKPQSTLVFIKLNKHRKIWSSIRLSSLH